MSLADSSVKRLDELYKRFLKASKEMVAYPLCQVFNYSKLFHFLRFHINNLGDPFRESWCYRINTLDFEREVIEEFAELFHAPKNNFWGYITNGGTEGNLYGLYVARELYPKSKVYFSDQTHYSVPKSLRLLRMNFSKIRSLANGEIDYSSLRKSLAKTKQPPIIFANIGTTMKGAIDDVLEIKKVLSELKIKKYYIHCDAAFFGMILPFLPDQTELQHFDFRVGIDSIAISGHKLIGTPMPCGVVIVKKTHVEKIGTHIEYTAAVDNTITGSRNGITPLFLWHEFNVATKHKFRESIKDCIDRAEYAIQRFEKAGVHAWRNHNSIIVVFPRPSDALVKKWQLAVEGDIAHLITLPQVSYKIIDQIIKQVVVDLKKKKSFKKKIRSCIP